MAATFPSDAYCTALGRATASWALLETGIDMIVAISFRGFGGHPKHPEIPRSLGRKIAYLRAIARKPEFSEWRDEISYVADEATRMKETRHAAVHGVVGQTLGDDTQQLWRMTYGEKIHGTAEDKISRADLDRFHEETVRASIRAINLVRTMFLTWEQSQDNSPS